MAKKLGIKGGFNTLLGDTQEEEVQPAAPQVPAKSSEAAAGKRGPGRPKSSLPTKGVRTTFIIDGDTLEKLKDYVYQHKKVNPLFTLTDAIHVSLGDYLKKVGPIEPRPQELRDKNLF